MHVDISKKGHYTTRSGRLGRDQDHDVTFVLREIKNPTSLYTKRATVEFPKIGVPLGYDFQVADFVEPYGKGKTAMCLFQMDADVASSREHTQRLTVTFPHEKDGIIRVEPSAASGLSMFKWLYQAPAKGYDKEIVISRERKPKQGAKFTNSDSSYAMRVNTELDKNGDIVSANYVRISKGINLLGVLSDSPGFELTYYFNPNANNRNLEFDPRKNLFKKLPSTEFVREP